MNRAFPGGKFTSLAALLEVTFHGEPYPNPQSVLSGCGYNRMPQPATGEILIFSHGK